MERKKKTKQNRVNQLCIINRTCKSKPCLSFVFLADVGSWCYLLFTCLENLWLRALKECCCPLSISLFFCLRLPPFLKSQRKGNDLCQRWCTKIHYRSVYPCKNDTIHTCTYPWGKSTKKITQNRQIYIFTYIF